MRHFHTAPRSGPSYTIQTQPAARSNRSKRLAAAEKRLDYCWPHHEVIARLASPTSAVAFLSRGFGPEVSHLYSAKVQLLKVLLEPGFARSRPETAEPLVPQGRARTHWNRLRTARALPRPLRFVPGTPARTLTSYVALELGSRRPVYVPGLPPADREHWSKRCAWQGLHMPRRKAIEA